MTQEELMLDVITHNGRCDRYPSGCSNCPINVDADCHRPDALARAQAWINKNDRAKEIPKDINILGFV